MINWKPVAGSEKPKHEENVIVYILDIICMAVYNKNTDKFYSSSFRGTQPTHWARINKPE